MNSVNWCLMAVSFALGLVLTLAFMIRRVKREVPVGGASGATGNVGEASGATAATLAGSAGAATATATAGGGAEAPTTKTVVSQPDLDTPTSKIAAGAEVDAPTTAITTPSAEAGGDAPTSVLRKPAVKDAVEDATGGGATSGIDVPTSKIAAGSAGATVAAGLVGAAGKDDTADSDAEVETAPYGEGSVRLAAGAEPPSGWDIKGNEDSMLYHTVDSPSYRQTIAELWFRDEDAARAAGFRHWKEGRGSGIATFAATEVDLPPGPHGPGSAVPNDDGSGPEGWTVKGNEDSMLYHSTESPYYSRTIAEVWFRDPETAEAAGFNRWDSGKSQRGKK